MSCPCVAVAVVGPDPAVSIHNGVYDLRLSRFFLRRKGVCPTVSAVVVLLPSRGVLVSRTPRSGARRLGIVLAVVAALAMVVTPGPAEARSPAGRYAHRAYVATNAERTAAGLR